MNKKMNDRDIKNAFTLLEMLRKNSIQEKTVRFLGIKDTELITALQILKNQEYEIENEGGLLTLKKYPSFNLSCLKYSYFKNKTMDDVVNEEHANELNEYLKTFKEPVYVLGYRKWNNISFKQMRRLVIKEMINKRMLMERKEDYE